MLRTVAWEIAAALLAFGWTWVANEATELGMMHRWTETRRQVAMAALSLCLLAGAAGLAAAQEGNAEEGAEVFKKCRACHDAGPEAKNKVGPLLNDIIGRKAGTITGFEYSPANRDAGAKGLVWTEEVLLKYLEQPLSFMQGTKMAFAGLKDAQDRKDVIAYLKKFSKK